MVPSTAMRVGASSSSPGIGIGEPSVGAICTSASEICQAARA
jgi:hypothetical protein